MLHDKAELQNWILEVGSAFCFRAICMGRQYICLYAGHLYGPSIYLSLCGPSVWAVCISVSMWAICMGRLYICLYAGHRYGPSVYLSLCGPSVWAVCISVSMRAIDMGRLYICLYAGRLYGPSVYLSLCLSWGRREGASSGLNTIVYLVKWLVYSIKFGAVILFVFIKQNSSKLAFIV